MSIASISASNHVVVYGSMTPAEKATAAGKVGTAFGRAAWQALFKANPNIISGHDIAVILTNNTTSSLTFYFEVPGGNYNMSLGCLAPTSASAAGSARLDGGEPKPWATAPGYAVYPQAIPILSGVPLGAGLHNVVVVCQQPVALLGLQVVDATTNAMVAELSAIQTFLYPNKKYIVPQTNAEFIVPALNTRLYGPTQPPAPPSTGKPGPDLSCYEPEPPRTEPPYIILSGGASAEEKKTAISQIGTYCARTQWEKLLTDVPGILGSDTVVILNAPTAALKFRFNVSKGVYNILVRCVMPSANSDSGFVQLDSMPVQMFTRGFGPTKYATKQLNFLVYEKIYLDNGMHEVLFTAREPMGYIQLIVNRPGEDVPDIVIPATNVVTMVPAAVVAPNVVYSTMPPVAGYGTLEAAYPTTTLPPVELTTTMAPTTTLAPVYTTTIAPINVTGSYTTSSSGKYIFYTFDGNGTISVNKTTTADVLIVGKGGDGGFNFPPRSKYGGAGGAGGIAYGQVVLLPNITYSITIREEDVLFKSSNNSILVTRGQNGKNANMTDSGAGGNSGSVSVSGANLNISKIIGTGDPPYPLHGGGGGGGQQFKWVDDKFYGGGGRRYTGAPTIGSGLYNARGTFNPIVKMRFLQE